LDSLKILFSIACITALSIVGLSGCFSSARQQSGDKSVTYYIPDSSADNEIYFNNVAKHFQEIGKPREKSEAMQLTAAVFIASLPPVAEVYENSEYVGKTNVSLLYFKPGTHTLVFKYGSDEWKDEVTLASGRNRSIFTQKNKR